MVGVGNNLRRHFHFGYAQCMLCRHPSIRELRSRLGIVDAADRLVRVAAEGCVSRTGEAKAALSSHLQEKWPAPMWTCASPGGCTEWEDANWIRGLTEMVTTPIQTPHGMPTPSKLVDAEPRPHVLEPTSVMSLE